MGAVRRVDVLQYRLGQFHFRRAEADIQLQQGNTAVAEHWAATAGLSSADSPESG